MLGQRILRHGISFIRENVCVSSSKYLFQGQYFETKQNSIYMYLHCYGEAVKTSNMYAAWIAENWFTH
jgi:hypothetical protein